MGNNTHSKPNPDIPTVSLSSLQDNTVVQNRILPVCENVEPKSLTEIQNTVNNEKHTSPIPPNSWSDTVRKNIPNATPTVDHEVQITYNDDGSANVQPSTSFLINANKQWETSLIGHFVGGGFAFKFVREQAFKLWKHKGLSRVFYSSKGFFTFRFSTIAEKDNILQLGSVQMGNKPLFLAPWIEGSNF